MLIPFEYYLLILVAPPRVELGPVHMTEQCLRLSPIPIWTWGLVSNLKFYNFFNFYSIYILFLLCNIKKTLIL